MASGQQNTSGLSGYRGGSGWWPAAAAQLSTQVKLKNERIVHMPQIVYCLVQLSCRHMHTPPSLLLTKPLFGRLGAALALRKDVTFCLAAKRSDLPSRIVYVGLCLVVASCFP